MKPMNEGAPKNSSEEPKDRISRRTFIHRAALAGIAAVGAKLTVDAVLNERDRALYERENTHEDDALLIEKRDETIPVPLTGEATVLVPRFQYMLRFKVGDREGELRTSNSSLYNSYHEGQTVRLRYVARPEDTHISPREILDNK